MKELLKVIGLLVIISGALVVIFWSRGSYGLQPTEKGVSCSGVAASPFVVANNFPNGKISLNVFERTFIYWVDSSLDMSYCIGHVTSRTMN